MKNYQKEEVKNYLADNDLNILNMLKWIDELKDIQESVRASEEDDELYEQLDEIVERLFKEIGLRMSLLLP